MPITRLQDLVAWQKPRVLAREVCAASRQGEFARDHGLAGQVQRAATSVVSNIAAGFERSRPREFHQSLSTAKSSCAEVRSLLYVASDAGYLTQERFESLMAQAEEVARLPGGLRTAVAERARTAESRRTLTFS